MSSPGEIVPEFATLLVEIAQRIEEGKASEKDAWTLRRLASAAAGEDKRFAIKVHGKRGRQPLGPSGVDRRLEMARAVKAYKEEHNCTNEKAYEALNGVFNVGPEALKKAWQDMSSVLGMSEEGRDWLLYFRRLEAKGIVKVRRVKKAK